MESRYDIFTDLLAETSGDFIIVQAWEESNVDYESSKTPSAYLPPRRRRYFFSSRRRQISIVGGEDGPQSSASYVNRASDLMAYQRASSTAAHNRRRGMRYPLAEGRVRRVCESCPGRYEDLD